MASQRLSGFVLNACNRSILLRVQGTHLSRYSTSLAYNSCSTKAPVFCLDKTFNQPPLKIVDQTNRRIQYSLKSPLQQLKYVCPSSVKTLDLVILDRLSGEKEYDCPTIISSIQEIIAPHVTDINKITPSKHESNTPKYASTILQIKRVRMNKHRRLKVRKKQLFKIRIKDQKKRKKKEIQFKLHLAQYTKAAADFDAKEFLQSELAAARRGGFYVDIYKTRKEKTGSEN